MSGKKERKEGRKERKEKRKRREGKSREENVCVFVRRERITVYVLCTSTVLGT